MVWSSFFCQHYHYGKAESLSEQVQNKSKPVLCSRSLKYHFLGTVSKKSKGDGAFMITVFTKNKNKIVGTLI